jgi:hypothetical protein
MFPAISNYDLSYPDPSVLALGDIQKYLQCSAQYTAITSSTNDSTTVGTTPQSGDFRYVQGAVSKDGVIAMSVLFATKPAYYNTKKDLSTEGVAFGANYYVSVAYSPYDDKFYYGGNGLDTKSVSATATGSAYTTITGLKGGDANPLPIGNLIYSLDSSTSPNTLRTYNIDTATVTSIGPIASTTVGSGMSLAPNGVLVFTQSNTTVTWYDINNKTSGSMSGTTAADGAYRSVLADDGYLYTGGQLNVRNVYRIDPYKKTVTDLGAMAAFTTNDVRQGWTRGPDGNIYTVGGKTANSCFVYNWKKNIAAKLPFTYSVGGTDRNYRDLIMCQDAMYLLPSTATNWVRFNNTGNQGEKNNAAIGSVFTKR